MGLDMYLNKKTYVKNWDHNKSKYHVLVTKDGEVVESINPNKVMYIEEEVAYWRKANAIHNWFVQNCQDGTDDCRISYVSYEQLMELKELCQEVLNSLENAPKGTIDVKVGYKNGEPLMSTKEVYLIDEVATENLPPREGFFFGSYDIDDMYIQDLQDTIKQLSNITEDGDYYYQSSW